MATVTATPPYNTNLSQNFTVESNSNPLLDASFSSYLAGGEKTPVVKLGESTRSPSSSSMERKIIKDGEISIFSAEKYFNGGMDEKETEIYEDCTSQLQDKEDKEAKFDQQSLKTTTKSSKNQSTTCSEASWNSKSTLVPALRKDPSRRNKQKPASCRRIFRGFGCNCCFGKKSVDIEEQVVKKNVDLAEFPETKEPVEIGENPSILAGNKQIRPELRFKEELGGNEIDEVGVRSNREVDCFTFPILNPLMEILTVDKQLEREKQVPHSLEVFGSPFSGNEDMGPNLENRLKSLNLDPGTKIRDTQVSFRGCRTDFDDLGSDTSSDLFEIEGLSSNLHPFFRPSESDGTLGFPACATFYEPSEESIDWSIVTASAANFSVASDFEDQKSTIKMMDPVELILTTTTTPTTMTKKVKTPMVKAVRRSRSNSIMNCRDDKAVQVASNQCKLPEKLKSDRRRRLRSDTMMPLARFQSDGQLGIRSLSRSRSAHMSGSLYMH